MKVVIGMIILVVIGVICVIFWHKKIDSKTTWLYGIYVMIILILLLFVLKGLEQYWLIHG